jgi:uncharacterized protein (TIGR02145 family)
LTTTSPGGKVIEETNNNKGVWVVGNARSAGSFSATVKLLTAVKDVGGACVYASNYPPVGEYSSNAPMVSFTGTPMYDIQLAKPGGGSVTVKSGDTFLLPCDYTVTSFSDATGAPGRLNGIPFNGSVPQYAASTKMWTVGSQVWSDFINVVPTCDHDAFTSSNDVPYCRSHMRDGKKWYYYNWAYVQANKNTLCPSPWRVPSKDDFIALDRAFGGTGLNRGGVDVSWLTEHYINEWGSDFESGYAGGASVITSLSVFFGAYPDGSTPTVNALVFGKNGRLEPQFSCCATQGHSVRCVK